MIHHQQITGRAFTQQRGLWLPGAGCGLLGLLPSPRAQGHSPAQICMVTGPSASNLGRLLVL